MTPGVESGPTPGAVPSPGGSAAGVPGPRQSGTDRTAARTLRDRTLWLAVPALALLLWLVLYPNVFVLGNSLFPEGSFTLDAYREFFASRAGMEALWNSVWISLASVGLSVAIGTPLAFLFARWEFPGRRLFAGLAALPVVLPPLVGVIAFVFLFGESGIFTRSVQLLLGLETPPWGMTGGPAILVVHAYSMYVYVYLFVSAGLARLDPSAEEAALSLGSSRLGVLARVTLPMLAPSILAASVLVFMTSMASFSAPYIFGGGFRVLTTEIFTRKVNGELGAAMVETVVLALVSLTFLWVLRRFESGRQYSGIGVGKGVGRARTPIESKGWRIAVPALGAFGVLFLLLPHLTLVLVSFVPDGAWTTQVLPSAYSLENYRSLAQDTQIWQPIVNSVQMATVATLAAVGFCFVGSYLVVRRRFRGRGLLSTLMVLPWALPGTVIAIALATTFSANQPWAGRFILVGTFWILPLAYFIRNLPLVAQAATASYRQFDPALEEAAHSLGASWLTTMRRVAAPLVLPGLAAGGLLAFVTALGEFVSSILLYTHRSRPISIEILAQLRAFDFGAAAALGVALAALMALVFVAGGRYVRGEG